LVMNPDTDRHAAAKALVDTGATMTVVPRRIAEEQMQVQRRYRLPSDGGRSIVAIDRMTSSA